MSSVRFILVIAVSAVAPAQTVIANSVTDPTGAVLQDVEITACNLFTSAPRVVVSSHEGTYFITNLPPGSFEVTFETSGSNTLKYSQFVVAVAEVLPLNADFTIRGAAETVGDTSAHSKLLRGGQS